MTDWPYRLREQFMSTPELIAAGEPRHLGELSWRIGVPVSALLLALLAMPLAYVNPRAGRSANLIIALLMSTIYINICHEYKKNPPPDNWDGVYVMHEK